MNRLITFPTMFVLLAALAGQCFGATFTSAATGNWSNVNTWSGPPASPPGNGDTVTIGAHTVTVDVDTTVGHSPGASDAIAAILLSNASGKLVIASGVTLKCRGDAKRSATTAKYELNAGAIFEFDASAASVPATALYIMGPTGNHAAIILDCNGTSGSHCVVRSNAGGANGRITGNGQVNGGWWDCQYTDFTRIGNASNLAFDYWGGTNSVHRFQNCTFSACGAVNAIVGAAATSIVVMDNCVWSGTVQAYCLGSGYIGSSNALSGGTRSIQQNYFDKPMGNSTGNWRDCTIAYNIGRGNFRQVDTGANQQPAALTWNIFQDDATTQVQQSVDTSESAPNYLHIHDSSGFVSPGHPIGFSSQRAVTIAGWVIDPGNVGVDGDLFCASSGVAPLAHILRNNLLLPSMVSGEHAGQLCSMLGGANFSVSITHNTYISNRNEGENGGISYGETYGGHAGIVSAVKSNLVWSPTSATAVVFCRRNLRTVGDGCSAANITHNGKFNPTAGDFSVTGYEDYGASGTFTAMFSDATGLGANDVTLSANPFVDSTRNIATWAVYMGYATSGQTYQEKVDATYAALLASAQAYTLTTTIPAMVNWVKDGFKVTGSQGLLLKDAGSDGVTIGAMGYVAGGAHVAPLLVPLILRLDYSRLPKSMRPVETSFNLAP